MRWLQRIRHGMGRQPSVEPVQCETSAWSFFTSQNNGNPGIARINRPSLFRRALKLVRGNIIDSTYPTNMPVDGLTVAAENPVYVQGNYNATTLEQCRAERAGGDSCRRGHSVVEQLEGLHFVPVSQFLRLTRNATTTGYRFAVIAGKGKSFTWPYGRVAALPVRYRRRRWKLPAPDGRLEHQRRCQSTTAARLSACFTAGRRSARSSTAANVYDYGGPKLQVRFGLSVAVAVAARHADVPRRQHADVQTDSASDPIANSLFDRALDGCIFCNLEGFVVTIPRKIRKVDRGSDVAP